MASDLRKENVKNIEAHREFKDLLKHAARYILWLPGARSLRANKNRFLTYFTLPGKWAFDIFFFEMENIIGRRERGFPGVRFCENNLDSWSTAKRLLGNTVGIKGNFEDIVLNDRKEFWDAFPYDIYNLDFCGTCLPNEQPPFSNTFDSINKIIIQHVSRGAFPFLLFLTMKAAPDETSEEAKQDLIQNIEHNRNTPQFTGILNNLVPNSASFAQQNFADFIILSVPKFICHLADAHCKVEVLHRAKYLRTNRTKGRYYITKFVFRFTQRVRTRLSIISPEYVQNVQDIMRRDNIKIIDETMINAQIRNSHKDLIKYISDINQASQ
jgi:hypothetical protein